METISKVPASLRAAQVLFYVNATIWLLLGAASLVRAGNSTVPVVGLWVMAILMFGNCSAMLLGGLGLGMQNRLFYIFAIAVLVVNILLTFTDQFGVLDFGTLVIDVALLGLLIATRGIYQIR